MNRVIVFFALWACSIPVLVGQYTDNTGNSSTQLWERYFEGSSSCLSSVPIISVIPSPTTGTAALAWDGQAFWIGAYSEYLIYKISMSDGAVLKTIPTNMYRPYGLAFDGTDLWVADRDNHIIQQVDTSNGNVLSTFNTPDANGLPSGLDWDGTILWYTESLDDTIYSLYPNGLVRDRKKAYGVNPISIGFENEFLWIGESVIGELFRVDTASWTVVDTISCPGGVYPTGFAWDGQYLWVSENFSDSIYQLDISSVNTSSLGMSRAPETVQPLYPNPTTGVFIVPGKGIINIYDLMGNCILTGSEDRTIDLSGYPVGVYCVQVEGALNNSMRKVVLSK